MNIDIEIFCVNLEEIARFLYIKAIQRILTVLA